jgi:hypothetical protein
MRRPGLTFNDGSTQHYRQISSLPSLGQTLGDLIEVVPLS